MEKVKERKMMNLVFSI